MDLAGFMASATRSAVLTMPGAAAVERNLAIISGNYLNLSLRLGYHFNVIDAYLGQGEEDSYLLFRFVGGVTELTRRERRAALLCEVLSRYDFAVDRTGDLVVARLNSASR
jgi:pyruvate,water dikinase